MIFKNFKNKDPLDQAALAAIGVFGLFLVLFAGWHAVTGPDQRSASETSAATQTAMADPASETSNEPEQVAETAPQALDSATTETAETNAVDTANSAPEAEDTSETAVADPAPEPATETASADPAANESQDTDAAEQAPAVEETASSEPDAQTETASASSTSGQDANAIAASDTAATAESGAPASTATPAETETADAAAPGDAAQKASAGAWSEEQMAFLDGDAEAGAKVFNQCKACHVADKEQNRVGPYLVNVIGRDIASIEDFKYSPALTDLKGQQWTPEKLNAWLTSPGDFAKGTKMSFRGLKKEEDRGHLLAYLWSLEN